MRALILLSLLAGCVKSDEASPPPRPAPVTIAEAEDWGARAEKALNACDKPALELLFDLDTSIRIAMAGKVKSGAEERGIRDGIRQGMDGMFQQLCAAKADGAYKRMKVREQEGEIRVLIRLVASDGANYIDWVVGKNESTGRVSAHDAYIYGTGQRLTETFRELMDVLMASSAKSAMTRNLQFKRIQNLAQLGQHEEALATFDKLDREIRESRGGRFLRLSLAGGVSEEVYEQAIADYERAYPGDPSLDFVSIDGYYLRKDYPKARAALERLEKRIGSDAYLRTMAANILMEEGKTAEARASLDRALELEPDYAAARSMRATMGDDQGAVQPGPGSPSASP